MPVEELTMTLTYTNYSVSTKSTISCAGCLRARTWHTACIMAVYGTCHWPRVFAASTYENSSYARVRLCGSPPRPASPYVSANGRRWRRQSRVYIATTRPSQTSRPASWTRSTSLQTSSQSAQSAVRVLRPPRNRLSGYLKAVTFTTKRNWSQLCIYRPN